MGFATINEYLSCTRSRGKTSIQMSVPLPLPCAVKSWGGTVPNDYHVKLPGSKERWELKESRERKREELESGDFYRQSIRGESFRCKGSSKLEQKY